MRGSGVVGVCCSVPLTGAAPGGTVKARAGRRVVPCGCTRPDCRALRGTSMLTVAALIGDHVKAGHAAQKLRGRGIAPGAIRTITRDEAAAREVATRLAVSAPAAAIVTG